MRGVFFAFTTLLEQTFITRQTDARLMIQQNSRGDSATPPVACVMGCDANAETIRQKAEETLRQTRRQPLRKAEEMVLPMRRTTPRWAIVLAVLLSIAIVCMVER